MPKATTHEAIVAETVPGEEALYEVSAFLIGQLGKNYSKDISSSITKTELLDLAFGQIYGIQDRAGGRLVIVEAEEHKRLIQFYESHGFLRFGERMASSTQVGPAIRLVQMFKLIGVSKNR